MSLRHLRLDPRVHVRQAFARIHTSLWLAPTIGVVLATSASFALVAIDRKVQGDAPTSIVMFQGGPDSAQQLLSTIASSMLTFTALVFSITIVALQLASNQFSPRVIRTFLEERVTKVALAMFVGTFVYAVSVLAHIRAGDEPFVPTFATWVALVLVLCAVGVFIRYIHTMSHSIRAIHVITHIAKDTRDALGCMFPEDICTAAARDATDLGPPDSVIEHPAPPSVITFIDGDHLVSLARSTNCVLEVVPRIGDFVPAGTPLVRVWGTSPDPEHVRAAIAMDIERTIEQDPAFGLRQLVDIAVRALSPGINDPSTATQALDHLHDLLRLLTARELPSRARADIDGKLRLIVNTYSYAEYVRLVFEEIRRFGSSSPQVRRRLYRMARDCADIAPPDRRAIIEAEIGEAPTMTAAR